MENKTIIKEYNKLKQLISLCTTKNHIYLKSSNPSVYNFNKHAEIEEENIITIKSINNTVEVSYLVYAYEYEIEKTILNIDIESLNEIFVNNYLKEKETIVIEEVASKNAIAKTEWKCKINKFNEFVNEVSNINLSKTNIPNLSFIKKENEIILQFIDKNKELKHDLYSCNVKDEVYKLKRIKCNRGIKHNKKINKLIRKYFVENNYSHLIN